MSCHLVAVVLTIVQTKQIRVHIRKRNDTKNKVQKIQNTVNTSTHTTRTSTHYKKHTHTHYKTYTFTHPHITEQVITSTAQVKTNTVQDTPK